MKNRANPKIQSSVNTALSREISALHAKPLKPTQNYELCMPDQYPPFSNAEVSPFL